MEENVFFDETKLRIIKNGAILPFSFDNKGGVLDCQGNFVEESKGNGWLKLGGFYPIDSEIRHSTEKVVYLGFCVKHWGHFIVECLGRVWTLLSPKYAEYKIVFLLKKGELDGNFLEFFRLLGIDKSRFLNVKSPISFDEIVIPTNASAESNSELYCMPFKYISETIIRSKAFPPKVYLSRRHFAKAKKTEIGEADIEENFTRNGYEVFYPEEMSLDDQVQLFTSCTHIACINGTIPLMCIFSKESVNLIVLNKTSIKHENLISISQIAKISPIYIDVYKEPIKNFPKTLGGGPFWLYLSKNMETTLQKNGMEFYKPSFYAVKTFFYYSVYFFMFAKLNCFYKVKKGLISLRNYLCSFTRSGC